MGEEATRAVVREIYQAYARRDLDRVAQFLDDDIDWIIYAPVQLFPFAGPRRGKAAVLDALAAIAKDFAVERYVPQIMIVEGDRAAVLSDASFTQRATGRRLSFQIANFLHLRAGRVIEFREFANTFDLVEQALGRFIEL